ncbi:MAG: cysteine-rich CWC family protein [Thermoplasmataceae archaeon]
MSREVKCEVCGSAFTCGTPFPACWCLGVAITSERLKQISRKYHDCICRNCLTHLASSEP